MATRRTGAVRAVNAAMAWEPDSEPVEMNGGMFVRWINGVTGESRFVAEGLTPNDQPNANALTDPEPVEETAAERVQAMLRSVTDDERSDIKVYRVVSGQLEYCAQFTPQEFEGGSFEMLRQRFGHGEYDLRLYSLNAERKYSIRSRTRIKIAPDTRPPGSELSGEMARIMETVARGQQQMLDALVSIKQAPPVDSMAEMTKMLQMMTLMREAMGLNQAQQPQKSSIAEIMEAVREMRSVAEEINPPKDEPETLMGMLPRVLDLVSATRTPTQDPGLYPVALPDSMQGPAPTPQSEPPKPIEKTPEERAAESAQYDPQTMTYIKLMAHVTHLCSMADDGKTPDEGASYVVEECPDEIIDLLDMPDAVAQLSAMLPQVKARADWFEKTRAAALLLLDAEEKD